MPPPSSKHATYIFVSGITVGIRLTSNKIVDQIVLRTQTGGFEKEIPGKLSPGQERKEAFHVPLELSPGDELSLCASIQYPVEPTPYVTLAMKYDDIVEKLREDRHGKKTYVKLCDHIFVTLDISTESAADEIAHMNHRALSLIKDSYDTLSPTTSEFLRICPRFRLLIIGNTGVGKSSLIRHVFGVRDVLVSESSRGRAEIDREFVSAGNNLFVIHEGPGLEGIEGRDLAMVKNFIRERQKEDWKDRLHAIWVCLPVPYTKGMLLEPGMEVFLRDRRDILGDIPVVVVLTKLDLLDNKFILTLRTEGAKFRTIKEAQPLLEPRRAKHLEECCTEPLVRAVGDIPHVAVSTQTSYNLESTLSELVKKTTSEIERYIQAGLPHGMVSRQQTNERNALLHVAGTALRATTNIEEKVDLTIKIGKKRYWANIGAGLKLSAEKVKEHLLFIHCDIIQIWNFHDPEMALQSDGFKEALLDTSSPISGGEGGSTGLISFTKWYRGTSESTQTIAKRFMAYIADLIYVMKILFILAPHGSVTERDVSSAMDIYTRSTYRRRIHLEVDSFYGSGPMVGRDAVADKLEVLVRRYNITNEEVLGMRSQMRRSATSRSS